MLTDVVWLGYIGHGEYDSAVEACVCAATSEVRAKGLLISYVKSNPTLLYEDSFHAWIISLPVDHIPDMTFQNDKVIEIPMDLLKDPEPTKKKKKLKSRKPKVSRPPMLSDAVDLEDYLETLMKKHERLMKDINGSKYLPEKDSAF